MVSGSIGGLVGSWILLHCGNKLEVFIDIYLIFMGIRILEKVFTY